MADWSMLKEKFKFRKFFYFLILLGILLLLGLFTLFFWSIKSSSQELFFSGMEQVHKIFGDEEWYCDVFQYESNNLIASVEPDKKWVLVGNEFTTEEKTISLNVQLASTARKYFADPNALKISYELASTENEQLAGKALSGFFASSSLKNADDLLFVEKINLENLPTGKYNINARVEFNCGESVNTAQDVIVSYPLYVVWSFDWEGYNIKDEFLKTIDELSSKHDNFPLTHLVNPRIFITNTIPQARRDYLREWLVDKKTNHGHSLGLHLHLFYENFAAAGLELPEKEVAELEKAFMSLNGSTPSSTASTTLVFDKSKLKKKQIYDLPYWGYGSDDGYDIPITDLSYDELDKLLKWSKTAFKNLGFGTPITYRSGGWFANLTTLKALENNGFAVDTSGRTKYNFGTNKLPGFWDLPITAQPYRPNIYDQNSSATPNMRLWEFPNNGADSWWYSAKQMIERFDLNWGTVGEPLERRIVVVFLSHPDWFDVDKQKVDELFSYTDQFLNSKDTGPVVYENLDDLYQIWENNF